VLGAANGSPRCRLDGVVVSVPDDVVVCELDDVVVCVLDDVVVCVPDDVVCAPDDVVWVVGAWELCVVGASVVWVLGASELCVVGASVVWVLGASVVWVLGAWELCVLGATVVLVSGAAGSGHGGAPEANPAVCVSAVMPTLAATAAAPTTRFIAIPICPLSDLGPDYIWLFSRPAPT
jgi:hypothetical protein